MKAAVQRGIPHNHGANARGGVPLNKRKKVAWRKHRTKAQKNQAKRKANR